MAGGLSAIGKQWVLDYLFRNKQESVGFVYLGLIDGGTITSESTLESICAGKEVVTPGYSRLFIEFSSIKFENNSVKGYVENEPVMQFGPWEEDQGAEITQAFICNVPAGKSGIYIAFMDLIYVRKPTAGGVFVLNSGDLMFEVSSSV